MLGPLNVRLVAYIDPAVKVNDRTNNPTYQAGASANAFIKSTMFGGNPGSYLVNQRNGKNVVYPDWMNDKCINFWSTQVNQYQQQVPFDGLWTTMNEPFGEVSGEISTNTLQEFIDSPDYATIVGDNQTYDQSWFYTFYPLNENSTYKLPFVPQF
jgi:alpha-glucosidase (family GH31 glycosyl hydrolase)